jgi:hypothetical protein
VAALAAFRCDHASLAASWMFRPRVLMLATMLSKSVRAWPSFFSASCCASSRHPRLEQIVHGREPGGFEPGQRIRHRLFQHRSRVRLQPLAVGAKVLLADEIRGQLARVRRLELPFDRALHFAQDGHETTFRLRLVGGGDFLLVRGGDHGGRQLGLRVVTIREQLGHVGRRDFLLRQRADVLGGLRRLGDAADPFDVREVRLIDVTGGPCAIWARGAGWVRVVNLVLS